LLVDAGAVAQLASVLLAVADVVLMFGAGWRLDQCIRVSLLKDFTSVAFVCQGLSYPFTRQQRYLRLSPHHCAVESPGLRAGTVR
jgi:hypothetical protein